MQLAIAKRSIFRRGRTPVRPAHPVILRNAQGRVPYIKLLSFHEHIERTAWSVFILHQPWAIAELL